MNINMPISIARKRATENYIAKNYDQIKVLVKKGKRDKIRKYAESKGISLNQYITSLIFNDMGNSGEETELINN